MLYKSIFSFCLCKEGAISKEVISVFEHFGLMTPKNILLKRSFIYMQQAELLTVGDGSPVPKADSEKAVIILQG